MTCRFCVSLCCQAHYRSPLNFSAELMEAAKNGLERIRTAASNLQFLADHAEAEAFLDGEEAKLAEAKNYVDKFKAAMEDDFNTADAISSIFELVKYANRMQTDLPPRHMCRHFWTS